MKRTVILLALLIAGHAFAAQVDPLWRLHRTTSPSVNEVLGIESALEIRQEPLIEVIVKTTDTEVTAERIRKCGGKVRTIIKAIITAAIPASVLENEAAGWTEAIYIEAAKRVKPLNDLADTDTGVTTVQAGTDLPYGYNGNGVIIGIVDTGIDLTHPAFKSETGKTRILYLWDQTDATGPAPSELESSYGTEYTQTQIDAGTVAEKDTQGHGTHVAGTSGGRDTSYSGVAPKASYIIVKYDFTGSIPDSVSYIFQKAAALGMPAVINLSLGSDEGAHDGTSLEEQALDELLIAAPGRAIAVAAGNSGDYQLSETIVGGYHASFGVASGDTSKGKFNIFDNSAPVYIDAWGEQACAVDMAVDLLNAAGVVVATSGYVVNGGTLTDLSLAGLATVTIDRTETDNSQNHKWQTLVTITPSADYSYQNNYLSLNVQGTCTSFDMWALDQYLFFYDTSGGGWYPGDNSSTVGIPATASKVLAVAAYSTRSTWTDSNGQVQDYPSLPVNYLSYFSSRGPAIDPAFQGTKPNIAAPGAFLISALSADADPESEYIIDTYHQAMAGTSMATPHTAGIVALMLQAYPLLTYSEITDYLQTTARADTFVGAAPNADWGYGKVDAFAAVSAVVADHPSVDETGITFPGITAGATDADYSTKTISVNFPRAVDASTINSQNLYINSLSAGSPLSQSSAWTPSPCDPNGDTVDSTVALSGAQTAEITLAEAINLGDFTLCLSPNVKDTDGAIFWGKTVQFGTSLPNSGCSMVRPADRGSSKPFLILFTLITILSAARLHKLLLRSR